MIKILIIEDNPLIRENTGEILELSNYKVIEACNGKQGIEKALAEKPDLVLCDIMMPEVDGYGVLHMLHKSNDLKHTPFIFLTAKTERADQRKGMDMGADDYLTKPFTAIELLNAIESRLVKVKQFEEEVAQGIRELNALQQQSGNEKWETLAAGRATEKFRKKQVVYHEGNKPTLLFYIQQGQVKIFKRNDDGKELVTDLYGPGDFFGYIPLMEGGVYQDTAEVIEHAKIATIQKSEFEHLMNHNKEISSRFIKLLAKNAIEKEQHLVRLAYNSLRRKVADALLLMHEKLKINESENVILNIGRENMASIAGTATESFIRTLSDFRSEGLIQIKDGNVIILQKKKLQQMVN